MTKKDYELLAGVVRDWRADLFGTQSQTDADTLARSLAYALREGNRRFDIDRFLHACSLQYVGGKR